jgi:hypothetical protein
MPYTAGTADLTVGPRIAAQGIQNAMGSITDVLQKVGMMHLQDQQAGAQLDAVKASGYFDTQPGQGPNSAAIPFGSALYSAAQKGPLGTKQAIWGTIQNFMNMNYQMNMAKQKFMYEQGGVPGGGGGGGQQPQQPQQPQQQQQPVQNNFDLSKPPGGWPSLPPAQGQ